MQIYARVYVCASTMDRQAINKSQSKAINSKKLLYDTQYGIGLIEVHQWCGRTKLVIPLIGIPS